MVCVLSSGSCKSPFIWLKGVVGRLGTIITEGWVGDCSVFACLCIQSVGCPDEHTFKWMAGDVHFKQQKAGLLDDLRY